MPAALPIRGGEVPRARRGRPTKVRSPEGTETRVRSVAAQLFYQRGIRAVSVDDIVLATGITKPTLYRSFPSKDHLLLECLRSVCSEAERRWDAIEHDIALDARRQLRAIILDLSQEMRSSPYRGCALTNAAIEFPDADNPIHRLAASAKGRLRNRLSRLACQVAPRTGVLLADTLFLLIEGASNSRHTADADGPAQALLIATDMILDAHAR